MTDYPTLRHPQSHVSPDLVRERLGAARTYVRLTRELIRLHFAKDDVTGVDIETVLVLLCVFIGDAEGRPTNVSKISSHSGVGRSSVYRRLCQLQKLKKVVREGKNYHIAKDGIAKGSEGKLSRILEEFWRD